MTGTDGIWADMQEMSCALRGTGALHIKSRHPLKWHRSMAPCGRSKQENTQGCEGRRLQEPDEAPLGASYQPLTPCTAMAEAGQQGPAIPTSPSCSSAMPWDGSCTAQSGIAFRWGQHQSRGQFPSHPPDAGASAPSFCRCYSLAGERY